jgi:hypothetical protein
MILSHQATIEERVANAAARHADGLQRFRRGCASAEATRWLITSSRAVLDRRRAAIRGGGVPDALPDGTIKDRLRTLLDGGVLTPDTVGHMWAWTCRRSHPCTACGGAIAAGDVEIEISTVGGVVLFLHSHCLELWATEAQQRDRESIRRDPA